MKSENAPRAIVFLSADADYLLSFRGPLMRAFYDRSSSCLRHFATPPMAIPANFAACC